MTPSDMELQMAGAPPNPSELLSEQLRFVRAQNSNTQKLHNSTRQKLFASFDMLLERFTQADEVG